MRLFCFKNFWKLVCTIFILIIVFFTVWIVKEYCILQKGVDSQSKLLKIGNNMPFGPGEGTFTPYLKIPAFKKFYVSVAEPDTWCINEDCGIDGAIVQTLGGWLQVENTYQTEVEALFGLDIPENQNIKLITIVGDREGKIIGIYPNKGLAEVLDILKLHPELADFNLLKGVNEFGFLKVGQMAPLKPGDKITGIIDEVSKESINYVPMGKKFYLYSLQERKSVNKYTCFLGGCRYPEPDPAHDFLFSQIEDLNGWFLANDEKNESMILLFGLNPQEVLSGKFSLVVLTDSRGVILALHPNKTLNDAITILRQHFDIDFAKK